MVVLLPRDCTAQSTLLITTPIDEIKPYNMLGEEVHTCT